MTTIGATDGTADLDAMRLRVMIWEEEHFERYAERPAYTVLVGHGLYVIIRRSMHKVLGDVFQATLDGGLLMLGCPVLRSADMPPTGWRVVLDTDCGAERAARPAQVDSPGSLGPYGTPGSPRTFTAAEEPTRA